MIRSRTLGAVLFTAALLAGAGACGGGDQQALDEEAVLNVVATQGAAAFEEAGVTLSESLDCQTEALPTDEDTAGDAATFTVTCNGTTESGQGVTLTGEGTLDGEVASGTFTGKEGEKVVFEKDCLGC